MVIQLLESTDKCSIDQIAEWYFNEWETPKTRTYERLGNQPSDNVLFQLIAKVDNQLAGTLGLCNDINLVKENPKYVEVGPWIGLTYTSEKYRNQGVGSALMKKAEELAVEMGFEEIFLYTFTAESLYRSLNWVEIDHVFYKGHDTVVMKKDLKR